MAYMDILEQENKRPTRPIAKKGASHSQSALYSCSSTPRSSWVRSARCANARAHASTHATLVTYYELSMN